MKKKLIFLCVLLMGGLLFPGMLVTAQNVQKYKKLTYHSAFTPSEGLVNRIEKVYWQEICLNGYWKFQPLPEGYEEGKCVVSILPIPQEDAWEKTLIKTPSPSNVNAFASCNQEGLDHRNYPSYSQAWEEVKMAWMKKCVVVPADWTGQRIKLYFEAAAAFTEVYVNKKKEGENFKYDPMGLWISSDGEDDGDGILLVTVGHYGDMNSMKHWREIGKFGRIGEYSMAYYGTPEQVSVYNGARAYKSQEGRMEGLANECYHLIVNQRLARASYSTVFNMAWYTLKLLLLGMKNQAETFSVIEDSVFLQNDKEEIPGVQPERIGSYCTTFNPEYDPNLLLYETWPIAKKVRLQINDKSCSMIIGTSSIARMEQLVSENRC